MVDVWQWIGKRVQEPALGGEGVTDPAADPAVMPPEGDVDRPGIGLSLQVVEV